MRKVIISISVILLFSSFAFARTITVGKDGTYDFNSIQDAIDDANENDTVLVYPGFYDEYADFKGKNIIVKSTNPNDPNVIEKTIINWGVDFLGTETSDCILSGFKINYKILGYHTHAEINNCIISGLRYYVIRLCDGEIINCLIADNKCSGGDVSYPLISECYGLIKNCTISNNGQPIYVGNVYGEGGTTTIENCIIYNNNVSSGNTQIFVEDGGILNISYSCIQGGRENIWTDEEGIVNWGPGNIDNDPCFVKVGNFKTNPIILGDYHLQSQGGRWDPNAESWITDSNTSSCIDAGNHADLIGNEPFPNGGRINMGFFGGTIEASKSYFGKPPCQTIIAGDINGDCVVNFADFALMASHWLEEG